jgi:hypothetical protein
MKDKLTDLNMHLFAEIERLSDEDLKGEDLTTEISRAKAVSQVSTNIILNAKLVLDATKMQIEYADINPKVPAMLTSDTKDK